MKILVGYLVEAKLADPTRIVWVRISFESTRERAEIAAMNAEPRSQNILETRVTPYYRLLRRRQPEKQTVVVPVKRSAESVQETWFPDLSA